MKNIKLEYEGNCINYQTDKTLNEHITHQNLKYMCRFYNILNILTNVCYLSWDCIFQRV